MPTFSVDLDNLAGTLSKRSYKFLDVKDKIEKIAFDIYRFKGASVEELWQVQNTDDGDYIVALYNDDEEIVAKASVQPWSVLVKNAELHIFYKANHICKMGADQLGFKEQDLALATTYLPKKLADNKKLVNSLLNSVDSNTRSVILSKYPELK